MIVKNVLNSMAVNANPFKLNHGQLSWYIYVGKDNSSNRLFAYLHFDESTKKKLMSSNPTEKTVSHLLSYIDYSLTNSILSWNELFKPENGMKIQSHILPSSL